jgi:hypothetical protein
MHQLKSARKLALLTNQTDKAQRNMSQILLLVTSNVVRLAEIGHVAVGERGGPQSWFLTLRGAGRLTVSVRPARSVASLLPTGVHRWLRDPKFSLAKC